MVPPTQSKANYIGAPARFKLEQACQILNDAFGKSFGCYQVGSSLYRADWRDVDVRYIMDDAYFAAEFPEAGEHWELDPKWLLLTTTISTWLSEFTGIPVDFQFQPQTHANTRHARPRNALGMRMARPVVPQTPVQEEPK